MINANGNIILTEEQKNAKINLLTDQFTKVLKTMEFDLTDQQIKDTPKRIAKMYIKELFNGCYTNEPKITVFENTKQYDEMVTLGPIQIKSTCSHHFISFTGHCYISYIPDKYVVGISKLARIVQWFMRRPQIQEELTKQIADYICKKLKPKGVGIFIKAQHLCMIQRGVEEANSWMYTTDLRGAFRNIETRQEFFNLTK